MSHQQLIGTLKNDVFRQTLRVEYEEYMQYNRYLRFILRQLFLVAAVVITAVEEEVRQNRIKRDNAM